MKTCRDCKIEKPFSDFYSSGRGGYKSICKECAKSKERVRNKTHRVKSRVKATQKAYFQTLEGFCVKILVDCRYRAKTKGLDFNLDFDWIFNRVRPLICEATGMPLTLEMSNTMFHTYNRPSLDRINSESGYTKDNCQIVSTIYNKAKADGISEHVIEMSRYLVKKLEENQ